MKQQLSIALETHGVLGRSYGVAYWHKLFPDWPLKIRCCTAPCNQHLPMLWLCVLWVDLMCLIVSDARLWLGGL